MPRRDPFALLLSDLMRQRGLGIRPLARAAGCDAGNLQRVLAGQRHVPLALVPELCAALACSAQERCALARTALASHGLSWFSEATATGGRQAASARVGYDGEDG